MSRRVRTPLRKTVDDSAEMAHATIGAARIPNDDFVLTRGVSSQMQRCSASRGGRRPPMPLSQAFLSHGPVSPWEVEGKAMGLTAPGVGRRREREH